jgi:DNA polymerase elongation subunit (family B)
MYVDAKLDKDKEVVEVVERDEKGIRRYVTHAADYTFYFKDPRGKYKSVYGDPLSKFSTRRRAEFQKEMRVHASKGLFESDINPVVRCLADHYLNKPAPKLHTCFFDIEVDFDPEKGFSPTTDPFNPVTAISCYLDWCDMLVTLCIKPKHMSQETAEEIVSNFPGTILCENEKEMFHHFFEVIEDSDILTGWNSSGYDIPYMVNRVTRVLGKEYTKKFCLWGELPQPRTYEKFDQIQETYDLVGRVHLDYLELYKKYNYESRHSYKLDVIGELEVGETKTQYEGSLDQLYNKDWRKFLEYNRQDTMLLFKIHDKLQFLDLANQLAHENTVLLQTVMGSVAMIEQAVINEAHARNLIVPNKVRKFDDSSDEQQAAGAYVATPKKGIHEWIGAVDINSLYPSVIRAINMAPETIIGQLRPTLTDQYMYEKSQRLAKEKKKFKNVEGEVEGVTGAILWEGLFGSLEYTAVMNQERGTVLTIDWERGGSDTASAAEIWKMIFDSNQPWVLTANGTIFTTEQEGVIPGLLTRWYSERKIIQKQLKSSTDKDEQEFLDKRQLVRKILLNSAYGALLNEHCRFYDKRIGQSTTLSGRQIVKHMSAYLNEMIAGEYDHTGDTIIYGDTDSCYFSAWPVLGKDENVKTNWNKDTAIQLYDEMGEQVNNSFPEFMERAFHCPRKNGEIIKAGRELVADRGIFITKKKYAVNIYDKEGKRKDKDGPGQIKAMGLDLKRADTPKQVQAFLVQVLEMILYGKSKEDITEYIREFKQEFKKNAPWLKGSPKGVRKVTENTLALKKAQSDHRGKGKVNMPGHVRASINWNYMRELNGDNYSMKIVDGMKIVVCKLKPNALGMTSIAYPTDELRLPKWFTELPFDEVAMEQALIDEKVDNMIGVLDWNIREDTDINSTFSDLFSFG